MKTKYLQKKRCVYWKENLTAIEFINKFIKPFETEQKKEDLSENHDKYLINIR